MENLPFIPSLRRRGKRGGYKFIWKVSQALKGKIKNEKAVVCNRLVYCLGTFPGISVISNPTQSVQRLQSRNKTANVCIFLIISVTSVHSVAKKSPKA
jgi:hypothetical protein